MLEGYKTYNLSKSGNNRFGGFLNLNVLVRGEISKYMHVWNNTKTQSVLWLRINKHIFGLECIIVVMYLPYEGSRYFSREIYANLYDDLQMRCIEYDLPICLMGDSNARTGLLDDFMFFDLHVADLAGLDTFSPEFCNMITALKAKGYYTERYNADNVFNNNDLKLIERCKTFGLRTVNERFGSDKKVGNFTCFNKNNGKSMVDYALMSDAFLPFISNFEIDSFDRCLSDVHCPVNISLKCTGQITIKSNDVDEPTRLQNKGPNDKNVNLRFS